jgi:hypothetical protein
MKKLFPYGETNEWVDLIDKVFITYLKSDEAKQLDSWDYQRIIMLYQATERTFNKSEKKQTVKLKRECEEAKAKA